MNSSFKGRFWKLSRWFILLFILLFVFRIFYGYTTKGAGADGGSGSDFFSSIDNLRKNYASEKSVLKNDIQTQSPIFSNQKFEKTASIKTKITEFEKDEKLIREKTKSYNAVIQYEQNSGQKGNRQLHLLIGVVPEKFDAFYNDIRKIGSVKAIQITKVDKTNEYRQLNAKKISIEKTLSALNELKSRGGEVSDFIELSGKILEVEERLQELGVELGNFDVENEFCTIRISVYEGAAEKKINFMHRIKVALEWTIKYFAVIVLSVCLVAFCVFLLILIADKLKVLNFIRNKLNE